jgi:sulfhydrogenase subunit beta (sulfur reductase)
MPAPSFEPPAPQLLHRQDFSHLIHVLQTQDYRILGPVLSNGAIQWDDITSVEDLPIGWKDQQHPGSYRLEHDSNSRYFNIVHGPQSLKPLVFAPRESLLTLDKNGKTFSAKETVADIPLTAVLGVRGCDLAGLGIQDRIFLKGPFPDPYYQRRRERLFLIAVNCTRALETCFCASMGTGPKAKGEYDLRLTETDDDFTIEAGSASGLKVLEQLPCSSATKDRIQ